MNRAELSEYGSVKGMHLGQLDVDYHQDLMLFIISRITSRELVFKGGTALSKTFGLNRFSEDLDFTANAGIDLKEIAKKINSQLEILGADSEVADLKKTKDSQSCKFRIKGVTYDGTERSKIAVRLEISTREKLLLNPLPEDVIPVYKDINPYNILVMNVDEILSEKVRALMTRNKARDLYDVYFIINKKVPIKTELIKQKLKFYSLNYSEEKLKQAIISKEQVWEKELRYLMKTFPSYTKVKERLFKAFGLKPN